MVDRHEDRTEADGGADRRPEGKALEGRGDRAAKMASLMARMRQPAGQTAPDPGGPAHRATAPAAGGAWELDSLASAIAEEATTLLGSAPVDPETDFFDAGATSVDAVTLVGVLARRLEVNVSVDDVFADARPRRIAERWLGVRREPRPVAEEPAPRADARLQGDAAPGTEVGAEVGLAVEEPDAELSMIAKDLARVDELPWASRPEQSVPERVLLTGATGFLGSHLLLDLLRRGEAHVYCLVRAADDEAAEQRLVEALRKFALPWSSEVRRRVTVLAGDIRQPRLGLTSEQWDRLAREIDSVVSVAAAVDFLRGYPSLRQTNVFGILTLAELAMTGKPKPMHHISSVAVFNEVGMDKIGEDDSVARIDRLFAGYDRAKWVAEAALRRARDRGLDVTIVRPGGIGGHTQTGVYNNQDLSCAFTAAFARYRTVPDFRYFNVAPVDWVSLVTAALVYDPEARGLNYHVTGRPNSLDDVVRDMEIGGNNVAVHDWEDWRTDFLARAAKEPTPELDFLVRMLENPTARKLCEGVLTSPPAMSERTDAFVAKHGLPAAVRYDARAQLRTYEKLAEDGLVRLPTRDDVPYVWFPETMKGSIGRVGEKPRTDCQLSLTLSIASMYQLARERRIDVSGEVTCGLLRGRTLSVESGEVLVRPDEGVPLRHGQVHPLLHYRLRLRDQQGRAWWLSGTKYARPGRDLWRQARTLTVEIGPEGEDATYSGTVRVPSKQYMREQVSGLRANPKLSTREQRLAKISWFTWFGLQMTGGLLEPTLRAGAELVDMRRDAIDRQRDKDLDEDRKRIRKRLSPR